MRTFDLDNVESHPKDWWEEFNTATIYALRSTYHTTLQASPTQLVFGRDMVLQIRYEADWHAITLQKQRKIN